MSIDQSINKVLKEFITFMEDQRRINTMVDARVNIGNEESLEVLKILKQMDDRLNNMRNFLIIVYLGSFAACTTILFHIIK